MNDTSELEKFFINNMSLTPTEVETLLHASINTKKVILNLFIVLFFLLYNDANGFYSLNYKMTSVLC